MASPTRRFQLGSILVLSIAALVLISAGAVLAVQWLSSRHVVSELSGRLVEVGVSRLEFDIRNHLDPAANLVRFVAAEIDNGRISLQDPEKIQTLITGSLAAAPQVGSVLVMDDTLFLSRITRNFRNQTYIHDRLDWQDFDGAQKIYDETKLRGKLYWGGLRHSERTGRSFLSVRVPIGGKAAMTGVVVASVSMGELSALTKRLADDDVPTPFILFGQDHVLAHPELEGATNQLSAEKPLMRTSELKDKVISSLKQAKALNWQTFSGDEHTQLRQVDVGGTSYVVMTRPLAGYGDDALIAGMYFELDLVKATLRPFYIAGLIGLLILALAVLAAVWISRWLARPIADVSKTAQAIGNLDFDHMEPMARSSIAEIDDLAGSFNKMLVGLQTFGRYVPKSLVRKLVSGGHKGAGSQERELTVMFTDMRSFTSMCEGKTANEVAAFINEHLTMLSECIEEEGGTIDKYIGDAVMAFWGAPDETGNSAERACRAALQMAEKIAHSNAQRVADGEPPVGLRVGIHSGMLVVGDIGSPSRINYTVVGDVVNITQRLEALGKEVDGEAETIILLSNDAKGHLPPGYSLQGEGAFQLKGRKREVDVYRLLGVA